MSKRAPQFERRERDFYPTPVTAVVPLLSHLPERCAFIEPCAGDGRLIAHLESCGVRCLGGYDIERRPSIPENRHLILSGVDASTYRYPGAGQATHFITNPPWDRRALHAIIANLSAQLPTWLLFDADWMHTRQSAPFLPLCRKIVSVGRVKWIPDSPFTGKDNCAWYLFDVNSDAPATFIGREAA